MVPLDIQPQGKCHQGGENLHPQGGTKSAFGNGIGRVNVLCLGLCQEGTVGTSQTVLATRENLAVLKVWGLVDTALPPSVIIYPMCKESQRALSVPAEQAQYGARRILQSPIHEKSEENGSVPLGPFVQHLGAEAGVPEPGGPGGPFESGRSKWEGLASPLFGTDPDLLILLFHSRSPP